MEAYVWQDARRPEVATAVADSRGLVRTLHFRAAELRWDGARFEVERVVSGTLPNPDCGLVIRIGQSAAGIAWNEAQRNAVLAVVRDLAGLGPAEIQCDYDCPQRRLGVYRGLLASMRGAAGTVPVVPTVLPSWLGESEFQKLAAESPGYVLQVHSLHLPERPDEQARVFDPVEARAAVAKAATIGVPFRVAMATYGCELCFDADGKLIDVVSEDRGPNPRLVARRSFAFADAGESARLVRQWNTKRPTALQSLIWYRLPIAGERRNWRRATLAKVLKGEIPVGRASLEVTGDRELIDLFLANPGNGPTELPGTIRAHAAVAAADGVGPYRLERSSDGLVFRRRDGAWPWLQPGQKTAVGWVRKVVSEDRILWELEP